MGKRAVVMDINPVETVTLDPERGRAVEIPSGRASEQDTHDADVGNDNRRAFDRPKPGFDPLPNASWRFSPRRLKIPSPFLDMAIARIDIFQQVYPTLTFAAAPVHFDQRRHNDRFASADDTRRFDRTAKRARKESYACEFRRKSKVGEMLARLVIQRLVDTALYAAGAVPRGMAVAQQREACSNQRCRSARSGESSAVRAARAAGSRCSEAVWSRPLRPAASLLPTSETSASMASA